MKKSEEILKRNITKFTAFDYEDNPSILYKDALKAVEEAIQQAKNNESLHLVSHSDNRYCEDCGGYVKDGCDNKDCKDFKSCG
tara:strand:- start:6 stop:254 length:249 start_codon:yes stop_codon:yes gene_type:complete